MIIANHAHIFQKEVNKDATVEALDSFLDECDIDKAVCFAPFSSYTDVMCSDVIITATYSVAGPM